MKKIDWLIWINRMLRALHLTKKKIYLIDDFDENEDFQMTTGPVYAPYGRNRHIRRRRAKGKM